MSNPFLDPLAVASLYGDAKRICARTDALRSAKIAGPDAAETICDLLLKMLPDDAENSVADIGCGRGSTTIAISRRLNIRELTALDASSALLTEAKQRFAASGISAKPVLGDFHQLPFDGSSLNGVVAAFCLYHSLTPATVIGEIARCLKPNGVAVLVTKSLTSYAELDSIVFESGLDPNANERPSLYSSFHSGNMEKHASEHLQVSEIVHERHLFRFSNFGHLARYLATTPKYPISGTAESITRHLLAWRRDSPTTVSSTVSYLLGAKG